MNVRVGNKTYLPVCFFFKCGTSSPRAGRGLDNAYAKNETCFADIAKVRVRVTRSSFMRSDGVVELCVQYPSTYYNIMQAAAIVPGSCLLDIYILYGVRAAGYGCCAPWFIFCDIYTYNIYTYRVWLMEKKRKKKRSVRIYVPI